MSAQGRAMAEGEATMPSADTPAVAFEHVSLAFDEAVVLRDVSFSIATGRLTILLGASGSGKSVVLKLILGLLKPDQGIIHVHGQRIDSMSESELMEVRADIGMLFQESALFDSMTVADNVGYRLSEETDMEPAAVAQRVAEVLGFVGLQEYLNQMPSALSGGQRRRVAIARAMASKPHLLLFDDPTSGLDPITAKTVMDEIIKLRDFEEVTPIVVTHQLPDAFYIATRHAVRTDGRVTIVHDPRDQDPRADVIMLKDRGICFAGTAAEFRVSAQPEAVAFLTGWVPPLI